MTETAIGYIRVSTSDQVDNGVSLEAQRERIGAYALAQGLKLVEIVADEGVSGAKPLAERAAGARLVEVVDRPTVRRRAPAVRHVIALKLDRLFRDAVDALETTRTSV